MNPAPHPEGGATTARRRRWAVPTTVVALAIAMAAGVLVAHARSNNTAPLATPPAGATASGGGPTATATVGQPAPNGTFTTATGATETIAALRGHATLVWLVANGCASCAVSIPVVAQHLAQLQADGVQVLTLGLYGAFGTGKQGAAQVVDFGRSAAGASVERPGWTWAMPSEALSMAYDPSGNPDEYFLIGPDGRISYHNSVPVSTMAQLLSAVGHSASAAAPCC
jgi:hypothetical protein